MNSNSIFLENNDIKNDIKVGSEVKLPAIIRLVQNRSDNKGYDINNTNRKDIDIISRRKRQSGNMAGKKDIGFFDFTMDFTCAPITIGGSDDPFMDINKILELKTSPTFTNSYFAKNFILLEITDYGHQAMSPGFRDFVPQVFVNGKKIWQKYIGIIRQYSKHSAYLVISKNNNLGLTEITKENVKIRIVFKNNIEDKNIVEDKNIDSTTGQLSRVLVKKSIETGYYVFTAENISDFQYLSTFDLTDYDIYYDSSDWERIVVPYNEVLVSFDFKETKNINMQNRDDEDTRNNDDGIDENERFKSLEYYRQSYVHDYAESVGNVDAGKTTYQRDIKLELTIKFSKSFFNFDNIDRLILKSRQNSYNAVYKKNQINEDFIPFKSYSELNFFSKSGERIFNVDINNLEDDKFEVIPEFTNKRKTTIKVTNELNEIDLRDILYTTKIYSYNDYFINPNDECVIFGSDGSFVEVNNSGSITCSEKKSYIDIYTDFTRNISSETPTSTPNKINNIEVQYKLSEYSSIPNVLGTTSDFTKVSLKTDNKNIFIVKSEKDPTPISATGTLIYIGNDIDKFNVYTICRSFPVLFEKEMIQPSVYKLKYPEWLFLNSNGTTKTEFFYSMEPKLYIQYIQDAGNPKGTFYYKTNKIGSNLGSVLSNNTYSVSGSINIINNSDSEILSNLIK